MLLYDAFTQRRISPSQSFCFDEIVPDEQRVADVEAELIDQGFSTRLNELLDGNSKKRIERLIVAERRDGPRTMQLWIYVDGQRHPDKAGIPTSVGTSVPEQVRERHSQRAHPRAGAR